jgi:hypothetical protein
VRTNPKDPALQPAFIQDNIEAGDTLCYDKFSGRYFRSSAEFIRACVNDINRSILNGEYVTLDDLHELLGLDQTSIGNRFKAANDLIEVRFSSTIVGNDTICLNFEFDGFVYDSRIC